MLIELTNYALAIVKYFDGLLFIFDITIKSSIIQSVDHLQYSWVSFQVF